MKRAPDQAQDLGWDSRGRGFRGSSGQSWEGWERGWSDPTGTGLLPSLLCVLLGETGVTRLDGTLIGSGHGS